MNAKKRKVWIRHRINQVFNKIAFFWLQFVVFTAERHDLHIKMITCKFCNSITMQSSAVNQIACAVTLRIGFNLDMLVCFFNANYFLRECQFPTLLYNKFCEFLGNVFVVDNARSWNTDASQTVHMWFNVQKRFPRKQVYL